MTAFGVAFQQDRIHAGERLQSPSPLPSQSGHYHSHWRVSYSVPPSQTNSEGDQVHKSRGPYARRFQGQTPQQFRTNTDVAASLREVCRLTYGASRSAAKDAAADAAQSPRAAENWLAGENPMSLTAFLNAYANNQTFRAHARKLLLMEHDLDPQFQAELARFIQTVKERA